MVGKKVIITGGCGFLGSNLSRRLVNLNFNVSLFIKSGQSKQNISSIEDKLEIIEGNLLDEEKVRIVIEEKDYLFHFAWQTDLKKSMEDPCKDFKNDLGGLINILESCKKINPNIKIVFPSTTTVIGFPKKLPSNENENENPSSIYDINKLTAEKYLRVYYETYNIKSCVLRLSNVFGEYQKIDNPNRGVLNFMIGKALKNKPLAVYGDGKWIRDYCYVQNYIDAFILAAESENTNGETYVLGSGLGRSFNEAVEKIKEITKGLIGKEVNIKHVPFPEKEHEINKRNFIADYSKFCRATGWKPKISFDEGIRKTIEFYINEKNK
ncbi:MAG: GDP-mannose 4,6-dehydratase [Nanoarchaeota archaeon]